MPVDNGAAVTTIKVYVKQYNTTAYILEQTDCQGQTVNVINNRVCYIGLSTLKQSPYNLVSNETVYVKVTASNVYGESIATFTSGAVIYSYPDAPINLANDASVTSDTAIKITWTQGYYNGGLQVLDYAVYYDQGKSQFV